MLYRLMPVIPVVSIMLLAASMQGCGGRDASTVMPRRTAYPRVRLCDTVYRSEPVAGKELLINADASLTVMPQDGGGAWVDVCYPAYGLTMRLTLVRPDDVAAAMANRMERIGLNVGDLPADVTEIGRGGAQGMIVFTPESEVTPLQMLATDNTTFVLYGVVDVPDSAGVRDAEELRPIVEAIRGDMIKLVEGL